MPELPEVETIARFLREGGRGEAGIVGAMVAEVGVFWPRTVVVPSLEAFRERLRGTTLQRVGRRGKYLWLDFAPRGFLVVHLRMSGDLVIVPSGSPLPKHTRWVLRFTDERRLAFDNPRKFGRTWLVPALEAVTGNLGPEPLDERLTPGDFHARLQRHRRQIKPLLMTQTFLAGLGNIYTDEALHRAGIHPQTRAHCLDVEEATRLLEAIREVLRAGLAANGASIDWMYRGGEFQNAFRVYHRTGEPCPTCGTPIERIVVGQRSTHFCPHCQPLKPCDG
ncbi:MAG TPA: bifunctional DNA-formamidopyrimidine glycosylase/DNA-(apurinic or apyrimidinic site) lyase [Chloroflexi bacterium]|nr:bifunctional DNA-formamidopyrimidine glycosylase/DNA-(apurinic or apyrimidinic site) lyase [Chloroflexota bacterium]